MSQDRLLLPEVLALRPEALARTRLMLRPPTHLNSSLALLFVSYGIPFLVSRAMVAHVGNNENVARTPPHDYPAHKMRYVTPIGTRKAFAGNIALLNWRQRGLSRAKPGSNVVRNSLREYKGQSGVARKHGRSGRGR